MPPKGGGGGSSHNRRNQSLDDRPRAKAVRPSMNPGGGSQLAAKSVQSVFNIAPLILEGVTIQKMQLNDLMKQHLADVKINNIQSSRTGAFTLYASDVKSFNRILNELSIILASNGHAAAKIFVPRSIQRIQDTEKVAFVKRVDLEIPQDRIVAAIKDAGLNVVDAARLNGKDGKTPTQTIRITFGDVANRNTFVRTGLQIDYMHFDAESATQNTKPTQCFLCLKFNHVAKYCKTKEQRCARCGDNHRKDQCNVTIDLVKCLNCKGKHEATSNECPIYQDQAKKMKTQVDKYTSSSRSSLTPPKLNDIDFPLLPSGALKQQDEFQRYMIEEIVNVMSKKMEKMIEDSTLRLYNKLHQRIEKIEKALAIQTTDEDLLIDLANDCINDEEAAQHISDSDSDSNQEEDPVLKHIRLKQEERARNMQNATSTSKDVIPKTPISAAAAAGKINPKTKTTTTETTESTKTKPVKQSKKKQKPNASTKRSRSHNSSLETSTLDN